MILYYDRIDISEGIDFNKTSESKKCGICHYWHFLDKGLQWMPWFINDIYEPSLNIKDAVYLCIINKISKSKAKNLCKISIWPKQTKHYKT